MASTTAGLQSHSHQTLLHSILILFSLAFLPRSNYPYKVGPPGSADAPLQTKSADKPQAGWLNPITLNPANTLLWWILGAVIISVFRAGWVRRQYAPHRGKDHRANQSGKGEDTKARGKALSLRLIQALAATVLLTPVTAVLLILLGAPLTADSTKASLTPSPLTPLLALLLNTVVLFIPFYVVGVPLSMVQSAIASIPGLGFLGVLSNFGKSPKGVSTSPSEEEQILSEWTRLFRQLVLRSPIDKALAFPALGSLLGAWMGVIPIALDWERPWQTYPLTPAAGAMLGFIGGSVLALQNHAWLWLKSLSESAGPSPQSHTSSRTATAEDSSKWVMVDADHQDGKEKSSKKRKGKSRADKSSHPISPR